MDKAQLQSKIAALKKSIASKAVQEAMKVAMQKQLDKLEAQLAEIEANSEAGQRPQVEAESPKAEEKGDCSDDAKKADKEPAKEPAKEAPTGSGATSPAKKVKQKITAENKTKAVSDCEETVKELKAELSVIKGGRKPKKKSEPARVKRTSEILADGISAIIGRTIKRELTLDKVGRIRVEKLREAREHFSKGLVAMRAALGGISKENDSFIDEFEKQTNEWIAQVVEKQKVAQEKQAA